MNASWKRVRIRFSLTTMLIVFTALLCWFAWRSEIVRKQRRALARIEALGGSALFGFQKADPDVVNMFDPDAEIPGPQWLRSVVGDDYFRSVTQVSLRGSAVTDNDLSLLASLPKLENLDLSGTAISNEGLVHLSDCTNIQYLDLANTNIDDAGLRHLKRMTKMWALNLTNTNVTDDGLKYIEKMVGLEEWLGLSGTDITDRGLVHLAGMTNLRNLVLTDTAVSSSGIDNLQRSMPQADISYDR